MSILLDTGVWFAKLHERDEHHDAAEELFVELTEGVHGAVFTTSDVVTEAFTLVLSRGGPLGMARDLGGYVGLSERPPTLATVLEVDERLRGAAWRVFRRHYEDRALSFTDCTTLAVAQDRGVDAVASFDDGFDGLVERVDGG